ncbi:MAG: hypothetical protein ACLP29_00680 [Dissulfurispiraceae bacterium]
MPAWVERPFFIVLLSPVFKRREYTGKAQPKENSQKKLVGYQIESRDGKHDIPAEFTSFEIIKTKKALDEFFKDNTDGQWMIVPVYEGDIEGPRFIY